MREPKWYDWLGATAIWGLFAVFAGVFVSEGLGAPEEFGVMTFMAMFVGGVAGARIWWLRRPASETDGLTTGEVQLTRIEELEARVADLESSHARLAELEDRLDFSERLLARHGERVPGELRRD